MNVLTAGGARFAVSHLAEKPLKEDYEVKVPNNLSLGFVKNLLRKVSINAYNYVRENFSYEKTLETWRKILREL